MIAGVLVALVCLLGVLLTVVRMPGTWLIVATALGYSWWSDWPGAWLTIVLVLAGAAAVGELVELLASILVSRKVGASKTSAWGGLIGGFVGMAVLSVPIPIIGIVIGALLGCFAGATLGELLATRKVAQGAKVGVFAAVGFAIGAATKLAIAMAMAGILLTSVLFAPDTVSISEPSVNKPTTSTIEAQSLCFLGGANSSSGPMIIISVDSGQGAVR